MIYTERNRARLAARSTVTDRRKAGLARLAITGMAVLALQACDAKTSEFFVPAIDDPGFTIPSGSDIEGRWDITYEVDFTSCETTLDDFTGPANIETDSETTSGIPLRVIFPDAPAPIAGFYDEDTGDYEGTTGPVDLGGGDFAEESYDIGFRWTSGVVTFSGTSDVPFTSGGSEACRRDFTVTGVRVGDIMPF